MRSNITILLLIFSLYALLIAANSCYFPNGDVAIDQTPCNAQAENSACCGRSDVCLENTYCFTRVGRIARGGCTDKNWDSSACPYFCRDVYSSASIGLSSVTITNTSGILFCCGTGYDEINATCASKTRQMEHIPFTLPESVVIFNRTSGSTIFPAALPAQSSYAAVATTTRREFMVGLSIGLPLLIAMLAALGMYFRERRLRLRLANSPVDLGPPQPTTVLVSMGTNKVFEFDGTPVVKELPAGYMSGLGEKGFEMI